ncbi:PBSX family phage terminase large subunit [Staphylococcus hominis]|uniref:PBSX family phage terminase large subunit n=1 Tax=Staphylococcus hominis TaxID=1290 RepID=UPI001F5A9199|nr:PBSX family phage terminase large subunit [Staphylococcus hominis]MCI2869464.1 PBSX family phage terminase large subunit [Staphylococcus hominis]MDS3893811.1 PBSX family phage terminase large subunit [Staphylococcus hominis]
MTRVSLKEVVGGGYKDFWNNEQRYRVIKGGRASKKSTTAALNFIYRMCLYPDANLLVIRQVFKDHKDSTYAQLKWAARQLQVYDEFEWKVSPLEIIKKNTGQKIMFRGLDDPMSVTSATVEHGYLCWCWFEEAFQVRKEDDFNKIDMSIRGYTGGLFKQITLTFNPWSEKHWLNSRFFKSNSDNIFAKTTNYQCNEFLDEQDIALFNEMKVKSPRRYKIEGLGEWGIAEGGIYENWHERLFDINEIAKRPSVQSAFGLDFGYTNDPTALSCSLVDLENKEIYIFDEMYKKALLNDEIAKNIADMGYSKEIIIADSAEPKSIADLRRHGLRKVVKADKGKDSIMHGIQYIQQFTIFVHPKCTNAINELSNYVWAKDKNDEPMNRPIDEYNHFLDALRYSLERIRKKDRTKR